MVQSMWFSDASGNRRRSGGPRAWNGKWFEIFSEPLWLDEPAWKVEADLIRRTNFPPAETVSFTHVPMPAFKTQKETVFHTNLLGMGITLHSMPVAEIVAPRHNMGAPGFALELDSRNDDWVPKVVGIWNQRGEEIRVPAHGYGAGYSVMRFSVPKTQEAPEHLTVKVTIQRRRRFTFIVKPTLIQNRPQPVNASIP
jgi:hypothetical protein